MILDSSAKIIEEFENVLLNGIDGRCASLANSRLLVSEWLGHEWLSLEVIEELITKINAIENQSKFLSFIALKKLVYSFERWSPGRTINILERERCTKFVYHCKCWEKQDQ